METQGRTSSRLRINRLARLQSEPLRPSIFSRERLQVTPPSSSSTPSSVPRADRKPKLPNGEHHEVTHIQSIQVLRESTILRDFQQAQWHVDLGTDEKRQISLANSFFHQGCEFLYSASSFYDHPQNEHLPEIVVLGASNVGKSSFLNAIADKSGIARVSQRPGHTTLMNAFGIGPPAKITKGHLRKGSSAPQHSLVVVDTPGYGYRSRQGWGEFILKYLEKRTALRGAVVLISAEKRLRSEDKWLLRALAQSDTRLLVVLTRADKGGRKWSVNCAKMAASVRAELRRLEKSSINGWIYDHGGQSAVYITAAIMGKSQRLGSGGGIGGVRKAILEMAGYELKEGMEKKADDIAYSDKVVSFDDIVWKI